jgi:hypothetical protein
MKAEILNEKESFEPIEIKVTIESLDELNNLWHRLNISTDKVIKDNSYLIAYPSECNIELPNELWKIIDDYVTERNK